MPPLLATPAADSAATCGECGSTLVMTGKPTTFSEGRKAKEFRGWVPSLLVTICPVCDSRNDLAVAPVEAVAAEPEVKAIREGYLERLGREADERAAKENSDAS